MSDGAHIGETGRIAAESIEHDMLRALGETLGVGLQPRILTLPGNLRVEVEGIDADASVLVQLVSIVGPPKSHHRNKAMADMFKLVWLGGALPSHPRLVLCMSESLARFFTPASWPNSAARDLKIDVYLYSPGAELELLTA